VKTVRRRKKRIAATLFMTFLLTVLFSGCWDNRELDSLFIVTGMALDKSPDSDELTITLQVGKTQSKAASSSSDSSSEEKNMTILLKASGDTPLEGIKRLNLNSSRALFLEHNQAVLFGSDLARQGLKEYIDFFLRDYESRMEVPVFVTEGPAEKILAVDLEQEQSTGMYLERVIQDLSELSPAYKVRMLDFVSCMRDENSAVLIPMVASYEEEDLQKLQICGMAIIQGGRMIGSLNNHETLGYVLAKGKAKVLIIDAQGEKGRALFNTISLDTKREVKLKENGGVQVKYSVDAKLGIGELKGFADMDILELMSELTKMAENQIKEQITETFEKAKSLQADIFGIGKEIYRRQPKKWEKIKDNWDNLFSDIELTVEAKVLISETGKSLISLEMQGGTR